MNYKIIGCITLLFAFLIFPASAAMVSFLVVETGLSEESPGTQHSVLWEDALMSSFFNAGHIVTNNPVIRMKEKPAQKLDDSVKADFEEAVMGGAEYFVLCFLNYKSQERGTVPVDITIRTYKTATHELVFEQSFPFSRGRTQYEEIQFAQNTGGIVVSEIGGW